MNKKQGKQSPGLTLSA